ncbi:hypothetical protein OOK36_41990 [Streptomyces sp. NBC_00365]|uniref:hypothetical protein n=1 Tax=Streptomyces sp. NBC_00365 TaxID=2975726 RepID=UPI0022550F4D|nr:hypothetical protein [Streptomyces sp. NBC_00365]MCX5095302.1 hypothetical protein [Streptomyces sp. NBC_00365]
MSIRLTYAFDAYCGWCHGFDPALHEFAATNADRIELPVLSGGLFTGSRALPMSAYSHIPVANERVTELTGVTFGDGHRAAPADTLAALACGAASRAKTECTWRAHPLSAVRRPPSAVRSMQRAREKHPAQSCFPLTYLTTHAPPGRTLPQSDEFATEHPHPRRSDQESYVGVRGLLDRLRTSGTTTPWW